MNEDIQAMRRIIDVMDQTLLDLINQRIAVTREIGEIKLRKGLPFQDRRREEQLAVKLALGNTGPISDTSARRIFELLMAESLAYQTRCCEKLPDLGGGQA